MPKHKQDSEGDARSSARSKPSFRRLTYVGKLRDERLNSDVNEILEIIADAQRGVDRQLKNLARRTKLSPRGIYTLSLINAGLDRPSLLVEYFDSLPSTMTVETDRLVEAGLIVRKHDPADRRIIRLELTRKGNKFREEIMDIVNAMYLPRINQIPEKELRTCIEIMKRIVYQEPETE